MIIKREKWVIKTLRGRTRSQVEASYQGFIDIFDSWGSSNKQEAKFLKKILDEKKKIGLSHLVSKKRLISAMSNMWEISQRFWAKYVYNNDFGYEEFEAIHWINHDFLVILNPEAFDIEGQIEEGIVNKKMFDYNSLINKGVNRSKVSVKQEN